MDRDLRTILLQDNPWLLHPEQLVGWLGSHLPQQMIPRSIQRSANSLWQTKGRAHLLVGPRQAGKSTTIWAHLENLKEPVLFIDCEQALVRNWCQSAPLFIDGLNQLVGNTGSSGGKSGNVGIVTLFFDEVQHLDDAGLFIKGLVDRKAGGPILVTGSSSYHLGARTRESLAGRATRSRLLPLSMGEVLSDVVEKPQAVRDAVAEERFARHILWGGFPEIWLSPQPKPLLTDLVEAFLLRDASDLFRIERPDAFRRMLRLMSGQAGQLVNLSEWSSILGVARDTVGSYLRILEESQIVVTLPPFAGGRRSELTSRPKLYFVDNGLLNHLAADFRPLSERPNPGPLLESWVFTELWKAVGQQTTMHFWRSTSGAEVDFVLEGKLRTAVEVKSARLGRPKLSRSARSFIDAYAPAKFVVVNMELEHSDKLGTTEMVWTTPLKLLEAISR